jgi:hypothetical protein
MRHKNFKLTFQVKLLGGGLSRAVLLGIRAWNFGGGLLRQQIIELLLGV